MLEPSEKFIWFKYNITSRRINDWDITLKLIRVTLFVATADKNNALV